MREWWRKKKAKTRKHNKNGEKYTFTDFLVDLLFWVPEVIVFPFRLLFWFIRGAGRFLENLFNVS